MQENYIVGIYARLSRDDERAGESVSIENQKEMLSRYVREQGWTLYDYYCDDGVSGTTFDRPGLNRLVQDGSLWENYLFSSSYVLRSFGMAGSTADHRRQGIGFASLRVLDSDALLRRQVIKAAMPPFANEN